MRELTFTTTELLVEDMSQEHILNDYQDKIRQVISKKTPMRKTTRSKLKTLYFVLVKLSFKIANEKYKL